VRAQKGGAKSFLAGTLCQRSALIVPVMECAPNQDAEGIPSLLVGIRVLLVEDDDDAREILATALETYGVNVIAHSSATTALVVLAEAPPDVLVSDLMMPGLDGFSLMRHVRTEGEGKSLPAIAVTGHGDPKRALEAGYDRVLIKPIDPDNLCRAIADLLRRRPSG
jgi:CheY-like chemotaxis protein